MARIRRAAIGGAALLAGALLYLFAWPVPAEPVGWAPAAAPAPVGPYRENRRLADVERLAPGVGVGPEDIAFGPGGWIYTGVEDGRVVRFRPPDEPPRTFARTGGRPLGLRFDADGRLLVADARRGLLSVDPGGGLRTLVGEPELAFGYANGLDVAPDGIVYFSNPSARLPASRRRQILLAGRPSGRLLAHDPEADSTWVALDSLHFPNGVAVGPGGSYVLVAETSRYRVRRLWLRGLRAGRSEVLADNLPGYPDGVAVEPDGTLRIALSARRSVLLDRLQPHPFLRKVLMRLARLWRPTPAAPGYVVVLDDEGRALRTLQAPPGGYGWITQTRRRGAYLYLGSWKERAVGRYELAPATRPQEVPPLDSAAISLPAPTSASR